MHQRDHGLHDLGVRRFMFGVALPPRGHRLQATDHGPVTPALSLLQFQHAQQSFKRRCRHL